MPAEGIAPAPQIAGDNIGVFQMPGGPFQGVQVVFGTVFPVDDQLHTIGIDQVFVLFLHEAYDNIDLSNIDLLELPDQPFNQRLAIHLQKSFGCLGVDGDHSQTITCRQNDGTSRFVFRQQLLRLRRQFLVCIQIPLCVQGTKRLVHSADGVSAVLGQRSLGLIPGMRQRDQDFTILNVHNVLLFYFREQTSLSISRL